MSLLFNSMAGYAFAKLRFRGRGRLFAVLLGALVMPPQVAMLPLFLVMRELGLVNSYWRRASSRAWPPSSASS